MTLGEAAKEFAVPARTLRYAAKQGHLKTERVGVFWTVTASQVQEWLEHGKHKPGRAARKEDA